MWKHENVIFRNTSKVLLKVMYQTVDRIYIAPAQGYNVGNMLNLSEIWSHNDKHIFDNAWHKYEELFTNCP